MNIAAICTGNTCRSPMLACLLRDALARYGREDVQVSSAGVAASNGSPASSGAMNAMTTRGLSLAQHASTHVSNLALADIDQFWCMSQRHAAVLAQAGVPGERLFVCLPEEGGVPDPFGGSDAEYEHCATALERVTAQIVGRL